MKSQIWSQDSVQVVGRICLGDHAGDGDHLVDQVALVLVGESDGERVLDWLTT